MTSTLSTLRRDWNHFFFAPSDPIPVATYRILFGLLILAHTAFLWPDAATWFSDDGVLPFATAQSLTPSPRINLFALLPPTEDAARLLLAVLGTAAVSLTLGWKTRASAVIVWLSLASVHHRNEFIFNKSDDLLRVAAFFLMFSEAGSCLSLDSRLSGASPQRLRAPWAQRLLQAQLSLLYISTVLHKLSGHDWPAGTAVYFPLHLQDYTRFPLPLLPDYLPLIQVTTWGTLLIEASLGTLLWIKRLRYALMVLGVSFHLGLEYALNIPFFQWPLLAMYANFIEPRDLRIALGRLHKAYERLKNPLLGKRFSSICTAVFAYLLLPALCGAVTDSAQREVLSRHGLVEARRI